MDAKKPYVIVIVIQLINTGLFVISKAAFNHGMNTFVFIFYRQAAASLLLLPLAIVLERRNAPPMSLRLFTKLFLYALLGNTLSLNMYNLGLKYTSPTVASATTNSIPVVTFFFALLLRVEVIRLKSLSGAAKMAGVVLCVGGVLAIALYAGPAISPVNHHRAFGGGGGGGHESASATTRTRWVKGTLLMLLSNATWSLWTVLMASLLREYPSKLLATAAQCALSAAQSLALAAAAAGRDPAAWRLRPDAGLLAVAYSAVAVTGASLYMQAWCIEKKGPVFLAMSNPLSFVFTIFCALFVLGEVVHLGSVVGGVLMVVGLYSVLWGKSKEHDTLTLATAMPTPASVQQQEKKVAAVPAPADSSSSDSEQERLASIA
ncbi:WAT1-related protein At5g64700 [Oryza sativa Japonica Group]|uniref:WAT1-related protein At5g64700 n=1 Tax=Oryza sativa subsp. japonica TaxID=39947 RepID=UPI0007754F83|nr:WAT1-related protein At5g64700 [Oryza sativa Japonica Group]XP_052156457.1 WAT1-related protein At5g64700-like [Oryza glaberrima]KAF2949011.1 hypothetical protein DAI22_01g076200 [Oryza sativa Japonica Group]